MTLVERDGELADLFRMWGEARHGTGQVVVISGPVATGKTELLHAVARHAGATGGAAFTAAASRAERALPLGVVGQLLRQAELPAPRARRVAGLLAGDASAPVLHGLCTELLDLSGRGPFVIGVDDAHHCDLPSLQCLLYLARRVGSAPVSLVLTECALPGQVHQSWQAELLRQPYCRRMRLGTLTGHGVRALLAEHLPPVEARRLAGPVHAASGGNPLLVRGLIGDRLAGPAAVPGDLVVGDAFTQAVTGCLYRCGTTMRVVATGLAVFGAPVPEGLLGRLVGLTAGRVAQAVKALTDAGLLDAGWFRHPAVRAAVLNETASDEIAPMHGRAAELLNQEGAPAPVVARHLVAAEGVDGRWAAPVLREAGEQAMAAGDLDRSLSYLRLADRVCADPRQQAEIKTMLARVEWRIDPSMITRHLPYLRAAHRAGHLSQRHTLVLVKYLLWCGAADQAEEVVRRLFERSGAVDRQTETALSGALPWLFSAYPELLNRLDRGGTAATAWVARAEQVRHQSTLDAMTVGPLASAVATLAYADRLQTAGAWCDQLLTEAMTSQAPMWQALFTGLRAMICGRQGYLAMAEAYAQAALAKVSAKGWGVAVGLPLTSLVLSATLQGRTQEAADHLKVPVPPAMFRTLFGLPYLQARGRQYLATGRLDAALAEFRSCGELMGRWGCDTPALVPWRSEAAQVLVEMGEHRAARGLVQQQLALLRPGPSRARAISLRALAATLRPPQRPALLREAVQTLQGCGDQLELAHTLADLSRVHRTLDEHTPARILARRAHHLAKRCGAAVLTHRLAPYATGPDTEADARPGAVDRLAALSDAERRVGALAALGFTNRQIADQLFVTVSTVEQHLTRVYRKLNVTGRSGLPLDLTVAEAASGRA